MPPKRKPKIHVKKEPDTDEFLGLRLRSGGDESQTGVGATDALLGPTGGAKVEIPSEPHATRSADVPANNIAADSDPVLDLQHSSEEFLTVMWQDLATEQKRKADVVKRMLDFLVKWLVDLFAAGRLKEPELTKEGEKQPVLTAQEKTARLAILSSTHKSLKAINEEHWKLQNNREYSLGQVYWSLPVLVKIPKPGYDDPARDDPQGRGTGRRRGGARTPIRRSTRQRNAAASASKGVYIYTSQSLPAALQFVWQAVLREVAELCPDSAELETMRDEASQARLGDEQSRSRRARVKRESAEDQDLGVRQGEASDARARRDAAAQGGTTGKTRDEGNGDEGGSVLPPRRRRPPGPVISNVEPATQGRAKKLPKEPAKHPKPAPVNTNKEAGTRATQSGAATRTRANDAGVTVKPEKRDFSAHLRVSSDPRDHYHYPRREGNSEVQKAGEAATQGGTTGKTRDEGNGDEGGAVLPAKRRGRPPGPAKSNAKSATQGPAKKVPKEPAKQPKPAPVNTNKKTGTRDNATGAARTTRAKDAGVAVEPKERDLDPRRAGNSDAPSQPQLQPSEGEGADTDDDSPGSSGVPTRNLRRPPHRDDPNVTACPPPPPPSITPPPLYYEL